MASVAEAKCLRYPETPSSARSNHPLSIHFH